MLKKIIKINKFVLIIFLLFFISGCLSLPSLVYKNKPKLDFINLPSGFSINIFAENVPGARSMALSPQGILFVGSRKNGQVYALLDHNNDQRVEEVKIIARGLNMPNGLVFNEGDLYVAEIDRILKYDDIVNNLDNPLTTIITTELPKDTQHGWRYLALGPDHNLYLQIGAPCNICNPKNPYASIIRMNKEGKNMEIYASGVRNSVGFDWHPETKELWFTDNGRDWLGDDFPPDELNKASKRGLHFGFPYCHGSNIKDPEYNTRNCNEFTLPEVELDSHVAALGMKFYIGDMFPTNYKNKIFIAEHGSWNKKEKSGYRLTLVDTLKKTYEVFADGWMKNEKDWGRPVDILVMSDGSILVSDDKAGLIYRISYENNE